MIATETHAETHGLTHAETHAASRNSRTDGNRRSKTHGPKLTVESHGETHAPHGDQGIRWSKTHDELTQETHAPPSPTEREGGATTPGTPKPPEPFRLERGYDTHLGCEPETGSHPPHANQPHDAA